jgi:cytochrome c-type biogenesis protein CcmF
MTIFLSVFVAVCTLGEFYKGARTRQHASNENFAQAVYNLTMRNTRRYGGYVIHLGIVLIFVGFTGQAFKKDAKALMQEGDLLRVKDYMLRCESLTSGDTPNYSFQRAMLSVSKAGRALGTMDPERRFFKASQEVTSHVTIRSSLAEDLYVVLASQDPESGKAVIQVFVNPLVIWVWIGGIVMFLGTLLALVPSRVEREMAQIRQTREGAMEERHAL